MSIQKKDELDQLQRKTLAELPNEILLPIIEQLRASTKVCLALTSHRFYELVIAATKTTKLKQLVPTRASNRFPRTRTSVNYAALMRSLIYWMAPKYGIWTAWRCSKFVKRAETWKVGPAYETMCATCARERIRRNESIRLVVFIS